MLRGEELPEHILSFLSLLSKAMELANVDNHVGAIKEVNDTLDNLDQFPQDAQREILTHVLPNFLEVLSILNKSTEIKSLVDLYQRSLSVLENFAERNAILAIFKDVEHLSTTDYREAKRIYHVCWKSAEKMGYQLEQIKFIKALGDVSLKHQDYREAASYYAYGYRAANQHAQELADDFSARQGILETYFIYNELEVEEMLRAEGFIARYLSVSKDVLGVEGIRNVVNSLSKLGDRLALYGDHKKSLNCYDAITQTIKHSPEGVKRELAEVSKEVLAKKVHLKSLNIAEVGIEDLRSVEFASHRNELLAIREQAMRGKDGFDIALTLSDGLRGFVESLVRESEESFLKIDLYEYSYLSLGSLARKEACVYSDFEFAVLIGKIKGYALLTDAKEYFRKTISLLELKVIALGETHLGNVLTPKGFCFDSGGNTPTYDGRLLGSKEELLKVFDLQDNLPADIIRATALLGAQYMFGSDSLFAAYTEGLQAKLSQVVRVDSVELPLHQSLALYLIKGDLKTFALQLDDTTTSISIKEDLLRFPTFLASTLSLYFGIIGGGQGRDLLNLLRQKGLIANEIALGLKELIKFGLELRSKVHSYYGCEREDLKLVEDELCSISEGDRRSLFYLYNGVLKPAYEMMQRFIEGAARSLIDITGYRDLAPYLIAIAENLKDMQQWEQADYYLEAAVNLDRRSKVVRDLVQDLIHQEKMVQALISTKMAELGEVEVPLDEIKSYSCQVRAQTQAMFRALSILVAKVPSYHEAREVYRHIYTSLPEGDYRDAYIEEIKLSGSHEQILYELEEYPASNGLRISLEKDKAAFRGLMTKILLPLPDSVSEGDVIVDGVFGTHLLDKTIANLLLDESYDLKKGTKYGRSSSIGLVEYGLYFKQNPELPGMEFAISCFIRRVTGKSAPLSTLVKFIVVGKDKVYPVQIAEYVLGENLQDILNRDPNLTATEISMKSFSRAVVAAMLVNQEDGKPDNIILTERGVVSVDNDHGFVPAFVKKKGDGGDNTQLLVKNILYCMPHMQKPLDRDLRNELLQLDIKALITSWLNDEVKPTDDVYCGLFKFAEQQQYLREERKLLAKILHKESTAPPTVIPIILQEGIIATLYQKLWYLKQVVVNEVTPMQLLQKLEPLLAKVYSDPRICSLDPNKAFRVLFEKEYIIMSGRYGTKLNSMQLLRSKLKEVPNIEDIIERKWNTVEQGLEELKVIEAQCNFNALTQARRALLQGNDREFKALPDLLKEQIINGVSGVRDTKIDFIKESRSSQEFILSAIVGTSFNELDLSNCIALTDRSLKAILQPARNLTILNISGCRSLTNEVMKIISKRCPNLEKLIMSNLPELSTLGNYEFKSLRVLNLNNNRNLEKIEIKALQLERLLVSNCLNINAKSLVDLMLKSLRLEYLDTSDCEQIPYRANLIELKQVITHNRDAEWYHAKGVELCRSFDYEKAIQYYSVALCLDPGYIQAYNNRGFAYKEHGRLNEALEDYTRALNLNNRDANIYNNRGMIYESLERFEEALSDYAQSIRLNPKYAQGYINRGDVYYTLRRFDEALMEYLQAMKLEKSAYVYSKLGNTYFSLKRYFEARDSYEQAIKQESKAAYYNKLGTVYYALQDYSKARANYELNLPSHDAYRGLALVSLAENKLDEALSAANEAVKLDQCQDNYLSRAKVYRARKEYKSALSDYIRAISKDTSAELKAEAEEVARIVYGHSIDIGGLIVGIGDSNILMSNHREYCYSLEDGLRLLINIRKGLEGVFITDPYLVDSIESYLKDDLSMAWQQKPHMLIIPLLQGAHWKCVKVSIDYEAKIIHVLFDDPYGMNKFGDVIKQQIIALLEEAIEGFKIIQAEKELNQQGDNSYDSGPIVFSNIRSYLSGQSYAITSADEHEEQLQMARKSQVQEYLESLDVAASIDRYVTHRTVTVGLMQASYANLLLNDVNIQELLIIAKAQDNMYGISKLIDLGFSEESYKALQDLRLIFGNQQAIKILLQAYEIGQDSLLELLITLVNDHREELISAIYTEGVSVVLYRLQGEELLKKQLTIKTIEDETKSLVGYVNQAGEVVEVQSSKVLQLNTKVSIEKGFCDLLSKLFEATVLQIQHKAIELIQSIVDNTLPEEQSDRDVAVLTFLYDLLGLSEGQHGLPIPQPGPGFDPDPNGGGFGDRSEPDRPDFNWGLSGQYNDSSSDQKADDFMR